MEHIENKYLFIITITHLGILPDSSLKVKLNRKPKVKLSF